MKLSVFKVPFLIALTFLLAMMLTLIPLPQWAVALRPQWITLVLIYWCLALPHRVSVGVAWCVGLFLDEMTGTLLGEHALVLAIVAYFAVKFHTRIQLYSMVQQLFIVFVLVLMAQSIQFWVQGILGQLTWSWMFILSLLTSAILWPWMFVLLRDYRCRFAIN